MGKGKKRTLCGSSVVSSPVGKKSKFGGFITVGDLIKAPSHESKAKSAVISGITSGRLWHRKREKLDECIYHLTISEPHPIVIICDEVEVPAMTGTLKNLYRPYETANAVQIASVTIKQQRKALEKTIRKTITTNRGIIITAKECVSLTNSSLPEHVQIKTVIHVCDVNTKPSVKDMQIRSALVAERVPKQSRKDPHVFLTTFSLAQASSSGSVAAYDVQRRWMPVLQARVSAARKLFSTMKEGSSIWNSGGGDKDTKQFEKSVAAEVSYGAAEVSKAMAGRLDGLRAKLAVAMSTPLPGVNANTNAHTSSIGAGEGVSGVKPISAKTAAAATSSIAECASALTSVSKKSRRAKMEMLGLLHVQSQEEKKHQAQTGRTLAVTRWMDHKKGCDMSFEGIDKNVNWNSIRLGASQDSISETIRPIVQGFREFIANKKFQKGTQKQKQLKREEERDMLQTLSKSTQNSIRRGRITAFGWRPSPFGEGEWGGKYGKCVCHNEVVMFYMRPFYPQEVLNTHICAKHCPAPGNEGYDGCLEFLTAQCRFFERAMTVWDDKYFHFIDMKGKHRQTEKASFLHYTEEELSKLMINLRNWTMSNNGENDVTTNVNAIKLICNIGEGKTEIPALVGSNNKNSIYRHIASYAVAV